MIERQDDKLVLWCECCTPPKRMAEVEDGVIEILGWHGGTKHEIRERVGELL